MDSNNSMLAWLGVVPMDEDELKRAVGPHNLEKETVPVMAWSMVQVVGGKVAIKLMPAEELRFGTTRLCEHDKSGSRSKSK